MVESTRKISVEFFKIYLHQHSSKQLSFPPITAPILPLKSHATLEDDNGMIWSVRVERDENCVIILTEGWQNFARHHSLSDANVLIFKYDGDSHFKVKIFSKNSLRKHDMWDDNNIAAQMEDKKDLVFQVSDDSSLNRNKRKKSTSAFPEVSSRSSLKEKMCKKSAPAKLSKRKSDPQMAAQKREAHKARPTATETNHPRNDVMGKQNGKFKEPVIDVGDESSIEIHPRKRRNTIAVDASHSAKKYKVNENESCSENLSRMIVMKRSYIEDHCNKLHLPLCFYDKEVLKEDEGDAILHLNGNSWKTAYFYKEKTLRIGNGWKKFRKENYLEVGDECKFELTKRSRGKMNFEISIIRAAVAGSSSSRGKQKQFSRRCANNLESSYAFFKIQMTPYYKGWVHVPARHAKWFNPEEDVILQVGHEEWPVKFRLNRLSKGWPAFVKDNSLETNDILKFELLERQPIKLKVEISKCNC